MEKREVKGIGSGAVARLGVTGFGSGGNDSFSCGGVGGKGLSIITAVFSNYGSILGDCLVSGAAYPHPGFLASECFVYLTSESERRTYVVFKVQ